MSQIPCKENSKISSESDVISRPTFDSSIEVEASAYSGFKGPDKAVTRLIETSQGEFKPGVVIPRSGQVIKPPNRLSLELFF